MPVQVVVRSFEVVDLKAHRHGLLQHANLSERSYYAHMEPDGQLLVPLQLRPSHPAKDLMAGWIARKAGLGIW